MEIFTSIETIVIQLHIRNKKHFFFVLGGVDDRKHISV